MSRFSFIRGFVVIVLLVIPFLLFAAEVAIDASVSTSAAGHNTSSPNTVFISDSVGYMFYEDSTNQCVYQKTTDGGASWGGTVVLDSQTDCIGTAVWYDRWTPGDTTGTIIHVATMDGADMFYTAFDTNGDSASTPVNATGANQAGSFTNGATIHSITKSTTGVVYMGLNDGSDSFVIKCSSSCTSAVNWSEAGSSNPFDLTTDWIILQPLASGQVMAIRYDISLDDVQSKVYNPTTDLWDVSWTTIDANAVMNTTYDGGFGATVHPTTNDIYLAYAASNGSFGTDDDIRTAVYSSGSWTTKTDVLTNDSKGIVGAKIGINSNNGDIYVAYTARTTPGGATTGNVYYKQSTNGMTSWGSETQVNSTQSNLYGMQMNIASGERLYVGYVDTSNNDQLGNTLADLTAPTFTQSAFRFFANANSTDVGSALAALDTAATLSATGDAFRLRMLLHVAGDGVLSSGATFKLQFVGKGGGSCASPSGGTPSSYTDVTTLTAIAYNNNASPSDGAALTANGSDPTHSGHTVNSQTYEESNTFTNSQSAIASGVDGKWDFSLIDSSAAASTAYCFRVVKSDGTVLDGYTVYPQITTAAAAEADSTAPSAVSDLSLSATTTSSFLVSWTAPGDDAGTGTATTYDLRYSTSQITAGNFSSATAVSGEPTPSVAGSAESMTVSGLSAATQYYFAIKTSDEVPNSSSISNVAINTTSALGDETAPSDTSSLSVSSAASTAVTLEWTAPGDDAGTGTANSYDVRYSTSLITSGNFGSATAASGEPAPSTAGSTESMTISGLSASTLYYFALKTSDEVPNSSAISNVVSTTTLSAGDVTAPAAISTLAASDVSTLSVTLGWTAPGDDDTTGTATSYDVRYSTSLITSGNFSSATAVSGEPTPSVAGSAESMEITGLEPGTTYYFAMKTTDDASNTSTVSNVVSASTDSEQSATVFIPVGTAQTVIPSSLTFSGIAYSGAQIRFYRQGSIDEGRQNTYTPLTTARADLDGAFRKQFLALLSGYYLFSVEARDKDGRSSGLFSFPVDLVNTSTVEASGIMLPPTVELKDRSVGRAGSLEIVGYAAPHFRVEAEVDSLLTFATTSRVDGSYTLLIPMNRFSAKTHTVRLRQVESNGTRSRLSALKSFTVSTLSYPRADVNNDGTIGIHDWSIFLSKWKDGTKLVASSLDMNQDGKIDIADFSIMLRALKR